MVFGSAGCDDHAGGDRGSQAVTGLPDTPQASLQPHEGARGRVRPRDALIVREESIAGPGLKCRCLSRKEVPLVSPLAPPVFCITPVTT